MSIDLPDAIYTLMTSNHSDPFYVSVGGQIAYLRAPEGIKPPICVYNILDDASISSFNKDAISAIVQVDIYCDIRNGLSQAWAINDELFTLLNRKSLTIDGHPGASIITMDRGKAMEADINSVRIMSMWIVVAS